MKCIDKKFLTWYSAPLQVLNSLLDRTAILPVLGGLIPALGISLTLTTLHFFSRSETVRDKDTATTGKSSVPLWTVEPASHQSINQSVC